MLGLCQPVMKVLRPVAGLLRVYWSFFCTGVRFCAQTRGLLVNRMHMRRVWGTPNGRGSRGRRLLKFWFGGLTQRAVNT
eukprot:3762248-Karenia_brevis.AAC.1